jgi:hypothetical protein
MRFWMMGLCGVIGCAAPESRPTAPAATTAPAAATASAATPPAAAASVLDPRQLELEFAKLEMARLDTPQTGIAGRIPADLVKQFLDAVNAGDTELANAYAPRCRSDACLALIRPAPVKRSFRVVGTVEERGTRTSATADAFCGASRCGSVYLLLELVPGTSGWRVWKIADVVESEAKREEWIAGPTPSLKADEPGKVSGPKARAAIGPVTGGADVSDRDRVAAGMRAGMRACFNRALAENPELAGGSVRLVVRLDAAGAVRDVVAVSREITHGALLNCLRARARAARFAAPGSGVATLVIPVTLVREP